MNKQIGTYSLQTGNFVLGGLLILLGIVFLMGELLNIRLGHFIWPFFIIGPGAALFILALAFDDDTGQALASVGGLVTMVGLILFFQNVTGFWASWSYAWALVAPTSIGLGMFAYGWLKHKPDLRQKGWDVAKAGLSIFLVAAVFFELIIGVSGFGLGRFGWPLLLIGLGVFLFARNLIVSWRKA
ncbi:MAG: hypothetical protein KJ063_12535 [Anaerolineae bacterium]|nr:hypothetical protein [Anaerolineae bacterium]